MSVCGKCHQIKTGKGDHCHTSFVVRGVLCNACNWAIGLMREDPQRILRLLAYVEKVCLPIKARPTLKLVKEG